MNIAILAGHNFNQSAVRFANRLIDSNIRFSVIICHDFKALLKGFMEKRNHGKLTEYLKENTQTSLVKLSKKYRFELFFSNHVNSQITARLLQRIRPDVILQFGIGMIRKHVLEIPRLGILNAHMGILPKYRGMNVLEWTLFYDDLFGLSTHWIDEGVDMGDVLLTNNLQIKRGDSIASLRQKAEAAGIDLLVETLKKIQNGGVNGCKQEITQGKQYFMMHPKLKHYVEMKLKQTR
jgi:methionyl-tRNA formyltransferase